MQAIEFSDEVIFVFVAIGHALERPDLVVDTLERPGGDRVVVPVENTVAMALSVLAMVISTLIPDARARRHQSVRNLAANALVDCCQIWLRSSFS